MTKNKKTETKPSKISNEDLNKLQEMVTKSNKLNMQLGAMEVRKHDVLHLTLMINEELFKLKKEFEERYGTDNIDINDGTIL